MIPKNRDEIETNLNSNELEMVIAALEAEPQQVKWTDSDLFCELCVAKFTWNKLHFHYEESTEMCTEITLLDPIPLEWIGVTRPRI